MVLEMFAQDPKLSCILQEARFDHSYFKLSLTSSSHSCWDTVRIHRFADFRFKVAFSSLSSFFPFFLFPHEYPLPPRPESASPLRRLIYSLPAVVCYFPGAVHRRLTKFLHAIDTDTPNHCPPIHSGSGELRRWDLGCFPRGTKSWQLP